jgi:drug/metabolite transporter (DMT)-like permease
MQAVDLLGLLAVSILWGSIYLLNNISLRYLEPVEVAIAFAGLAALVLALITIVETVRTQSWKSTAQPHRPSIPNETTHLIAERSGDSVHSHGSPSTPLRTGTPNSQRRQPQPATVEQLPTIRWGDWSFWKMTLRQTMTVGFLCQGFGNFSFAEAGNGFSSGVLGIIFCLEPIFSAIFAVLFKVKGARLTKSTISGMFVSFIGIILVVYPDVLHGSNQVADPAMGIGVKIWYGFIALLSPAVYGLSAIVNQMFMEENPIPLYFNLCGQMFFGTVYLVIQSCIQNIATKKFIFQSIVNIINVKHEAWIYLSTSSVSSSVICWAIFLWLISRIGARASMYAFLVPCVALVLGATLNHEMDDLSAGFIVLQIVGVVVVLGGMALVVKDEFAHSDQQTAAIATAPEIPEPRGIVTAKMSIGSYHSHDEDFIIKDERAALIAQSPRSVHGKSRSFN